MSTILVPSLRISGRATLDWYVEALDATLIAVYGEGDVVDHAQLAVCGQMAMFGTGGRRDQPVGGSVVYVVVGSREEVDAIHARAEAAGAPITHEPYEPPYGGWEFGTTDPDGNGWSFGTYAGEAA